MKSFNQRTDEPIHSLLTNASRWGWNVGGVETRLWDTWPFGCDKGLRHMTLWVWQGFETDDPSGVTRVWERWPFGCDKALRHMTLWVWQGFETHDPLGVTRVWDRWPFGCDKGLRKMTLWVWQGFEKDDPSGVTRVWGRWPFRYDKGLRKITLQVWQGFEKDDPSDVLTICNNSTADNIGSIPRFSTPFSSKVVIYGHHLATRPLTVITVTLIAASPNAKNISSVTLTVQLRHSPPTPPPHF